MFFSEYFFDGLALAVEDDGVAGVFAAEGGVDGCLGGDGEVDVVSDHEFACTDGYEKPLPVGDDAGTMLGCVEGWQLE